jgi:hypothetical protein
LQPIVVYWRIVDAKASQKRVGERHRGVGMCVGCEALEGGGVLGTEHGVRRGHVCVGLPSSARAFLCSFPRGFVTAAGQKGSKRVKASKVRRRLMATTTLDDAGRTLQQFG